MDRDTVRGGSLGEFPYLDLWEERIQGIIHYQMELGNTTGRGRIGWYIVVMTGGMRPDWCIWREAREVETAKRRCLIKHFLSDPLMTDKICRVPRPLQFSRPAFGSARMPFPSDTTCENRHEAKKPSPILTILPGKSTVSSNDSANTRTPSWARGAGNAKDRKRANAQSSIVHRCGRATHSAARRRPT
jgi:hypothetical protein